MSTSDCHIDSIESTSSCNEDGAIPHSAVSAPPQDTLLEVEEGSGVVDNTGGEIDEKEEKDSAREELEEYTAQCEERIGLQEQEALQFQKEIADRDAEISTLKQELAVQAKQLDTVHVTVESEIKSLQSCAAGLRKMASWLKLFPPYTAYNALPPESDSEEYKVMVSWAEHIRKELAGVYKYNIHIIYAYLEDGQYSSLRTDGNIATVCFLGSQTSGYKVEFDGTAAKGIFFAPLHFDLSKTMWLDLEEEWNDFVKYDMHRPVLVRIQPRQTATDGIEFHITEYEMGSGRELVMRRFWKQFDLWRGL